MSRVVHHNLKLFTTLINMTKLLKGFKPLSIRFSDESTASHTMFMKEHSVRNQSADQPINRSLYLINVPPWATDESLTKSFNQYASVESLTFAKLKETVQSGFKAAFVVFNSEQELQKALQIEMLPALSTAAEPLVLGVEKWANDYNHAMTNQLNLEQSMLQIIHDYDTKQNDEKMKAKQAEDDGWTLVTKKGRNPGVSRKESVNTKLLAKSKKEKVLKNFYRHQIRQAKRDQLATLRKQAEEDKKKILALKQRRAFKPF